MLCCHRPYFVCAGGKHLIHVIFSPGLIGGHNDRHPRPLVAIACVEQKGSMWIGPPSRRWECT